MGRIFFFGIGWKASFAFVAAFLFGLDGGSAITIDVSGSYFGDVNSVSFSDGFCGGAGTKVLFGFTGIRTRNALVTFEWMDETALKSSAILLCFIFILPSNFFLASFACWFIKSSVIFPDGTFGFLLA